MIQKKICMLGSFAVGKTSLVRRFVDSIFTDIYTTTIGVKIDRKIVKIDDVEIKLLLWDVYGEDNHQSVLPAYLRGAAGYILVVDPTRPNTYDSAEKLHTLVSETLGQLPFALVLNKSDLKSEWQLEESEYSNLKSQAVCTIETSAKTGTNVESIFDSLANEFVKVPTR